MKILIQNLGLTLFIIGIAVLVFGVLQETTGNITLQVSGALIVLGLIVHVIVSRKYF